MNLVWDPASTRGAPLKDDWILPWYGSYPCVLRLLSTKIYGLETREDSLIPSIQESSAPFIVSSIMAWFRIRKWQNWLFVCTCCIVPSSIAFSLALVRICVHAAIPRIRMS